MKRLLVVTVLLALGVFLVFSLVAAQAVTPTGSAVDKSAEGPVSLSAMGARTSHTLVQNMENVQASLHIQYYKDTGAIAWEFDDVLPANGSKTYHANDYAALGPSFLGSMVVSSDRQIVAVVVNAGSTSQDIYEGASQGAVEEFLPSVHWKNAQYTLTGFQNTDPSVAATVVISYFNPSGGLLNQNQVTIPPNSAIHQDARTYVVGNPAEEGSIKATSLNGQKIALAAIESLYDETYSYRGFMPDQGAMTVFLPSLHRNLGGQFSHTLVQNMTGATNNITMTYYKPDGSPAGTFNKVLAPNGAYTFHTGPGWLDDPVGLGNEGTGKLVSSGNVLAVVVETVGSAAYAYNGQTSADAAKSILFPSVHRNLGGQFSHTLVQNLSTTDSANLTVTYFNQNGTVANVFNKVLAPSGAYTFHTPPGSLEDPIALGNEGSLRVECTNCTTLPKQIVAVMVETLFGGRIGAYSGFKQQ